MSKVINFLSDKSNMVGKSTFREKDRRVFERHGYRCHYCNTIHALTIDHVVPRAKGGTNDETNLVPACRTCNSQKRNRDYDEFVEWREAAVLAFETYHSMADCL